MGYPQAVREGIWFNMHSEISLPLKNAMFYMVAFLYSKHFVQYIIDFHLSKAKQQSEKYNGRKKARKEALKRAFAVAPTVSSTEGRTMYCTMDSLSTWMKYTFVPITVSSQYFWVQMSTYVHEITI